MPVAARDRLARMFAGQQLPAPANAQLPVSLGGLRVAVAGVGELQFPVRAAQARRLRGMGLPARFGMGTHTVTDTRVRDTWQIPIEGVRVDWGGHEEQLLDAARGALDLPTGTRLATELHSMLVYEPGQFFTWHQDSEKSDAMVASLVITLPTACTGGELVIHQAGSEVAYAGSRTEPTAVAFYADRFHEVREVRTGRRITLTFNLMITEQPAHDHQHDGAVVTQIAGLLTEHFSTRQRIRWQADQHPRRLVYLLDHEYTERGLDWARLKGVDAERANLLRAGAERADCEVGLALMEIHESWQCLPDWPDRRDYWAYDDEDDADDRDEQDDRNPVLDPKSSELIEAEVALTHWRLPVASSLEPAALSISDFEVCATTPTVDRRPHAAEYEGYMGNYGNTMDRWYRRAGILVLPTELAFANRAEAFPTWALDDLLARAQADQTERISADVTSLAGCWTPGVGSAANLGKALRLAGSLAAEDAELVLGPFSIEALNPSQMADLAALADRHGRSWVDGRLARWIENAGTPYAPGQFDQWLLSLPEWCAALPEAEIAGSVLTRAWDVLDSRLRASAGERRRSVRLQRLGSLARPLAKLLEAAAVVGGHRVSDRALAAYEDQDELIHSVLPALRTAAGWSQEVRERAGVAPLAAHTAQLLSAQLARTPREPDDWSISPIPGCECDVCAQLNIFLADRQKPSREWPLAKPGRQHVHSQIDQAELPVTHQTRRTGRPYTLILTKTPALFERERQSREQATTDLAWLVEQWPNSKRSASS